MPYFVIKSATPQMLGTALFATPRIASTPSAFPLRTLAGPFMQPSSRPETMTFW